MRPDAVSMLLPDWFLSLPTVERPRKNNAVAEKELASVVKTSSNKAGSLLQKDKQFYENDNLPKSDNISCDLFVVLSSTLASFQVR